MTDDTIHPQQVIAQKKAADVAAQRSANAAIINHANTVGIRFVEVDPMSGMMDEATNKPPKAGRLTIAYLEDRRNIVMISTAICHPGDKFDKRTGRAIAAQGLLNGQFIQLRKPTRFNGSMKQWIKQTFTQYGQ